MKAALLTGVRQMELRDVPDPELTNPRDVLLKVDAVGVCGSDLHYYTIGRIGSQIVNYPQRIGHECAGTIVAVGREVKGLEPGHKVAVDPLASCGQCDLCRSGRANICRHQSFLGCPGQAPGALAEYLVMPAACCYPVPGSISSAETVVMEPFSIGLYAQRVANLQRAAKIAILGSGPIGLCVLLACRAAAQCTTYMTDLIDDRLALARRCGADWTGHPPQIDHVESLGMDFVFECAGKQETLDQAVELLKPGGTLLIVGIPEEDRVSFSIHTLRRKEIRLINVRRQNNCTAPAIQLVARGKVNLAPLVTHHFSLTEAKQAHDLVAEYRDGVVKAIIHVAP